MHRIRGRLFVVKMENRGTTMIDDQFEFGFDLLLDGLEKSLGV